MTPVRFYCFRRSFPVYNRVFVLKATKMEMPLWLAKGLYERKRRVLSVELPKVYREGWRTVFSADPTVVDLHKMGPYYYGLGSQLLHFQNPENPEIAQAVLQVSPRKLHLIDMHLPLYWSYCIP